MSATRVRIGQQGYELWDIFLNDDQVFGVVEAKEGLAPNGCVVREVRGAHGLLYRADGKPQYNVTYGKVEIRRKPK